MQRKLFCLHNVVVDTRFEVNGIAFLLNKLIFSSIRDLCTKPFSPYCSVVKKIILILYEGCLKWTVAFTIEFKFWLIAGQFFVFEPILQQRICVSGYSYFGGRNVVFEKAVSENLSDLSLRYYGIVLLSWFRRISNKRPVLFPHTTTTKI